MSGYDVLMVLWGIVFVALWIAFIYAMNRLLQRENLSQDSLAAASGSARDAETPRPMAPAA